MFNISALTGTEQTRVVKGLWGDDDDTIDRDSFRALLLSSQEISEKEVDAVSPPPPSSNTESVSTTEKSSQTQFQVAQVPSAMFNKPGYTAFPRSGSTVEPKVQPNSCNCCPIL